MVAFEDENFEGRLVFIPLGEYNIKNIFGEGSTKLGSINPSYHLTVTLYDQPNLEGNSIVRRGNHPKIVKKEEELTESEKKDKDEEGIFNAESVKIEWRDGVIVYTEPNYQGRSLYLPVGAYQFDDFDRLNIGSMRASEQYNIHFYSEDDHDGAISIQTMTCANVTGTLSGYTVRSMHVGYECRCVHGYCDQPNGKCKCVGEFYGEWCQRHDVREAKLEKELFYRNLYDKLKIPGLVCAALVPLVLLCLCNRKKSADGSDNATKRKGKKPRKDESKKKK